MEERVQMTRIHRLKALCLTGFILLAGYVSTSSHAAAPGTDQPSADVSTAPDAPASPTDSALTLAPPASEIGLRASRETLFPADPTLPLTDIQSGSRSVVALRPPADIWERIRRGFAMPDLQSNLVHDREQWYATRPDSMFRMTERSRKYLFYIVEELERRNMPTELALLPFIESAYNPQAVSSAKAAGMWQFMPATGKHFELKQNVFRDDRRGVLESTRAALDYLQKLYGMFGDWQLALAAYNWGEGSVSRAIARNKAAGLGLSYSELNMPAETRFYVPKLQAVKNLIAAPEGFQAKLPLIENHPYFQSVLITRDIDVALAARLAEVSIEDFKALNPSMHRPVILAAGTPQILLPWDNAAIFQRNLDAYTGGQLASWTAWVAPSTMKPQEAAQQAGMSEEDFRSVNNIPPRMLIKAGSTLLVARSEKVASDVAPSVADNGQMALAPDVVLKRSMVRARKGDTVSSLAQRFGVSAASVAEWNKLGKSAGLQKGQSIVVFLPSRARASVTSRSTARTGNHKAAPASTRHQTARTARSPHSSAGKAPRKHRR
jgi:membrane-bound lytic murein transglycosylase D